MVVVVRSRGSWSGHSHHHQTHGQQLIVIRATPYDYRDQTNRLASVTTSQVEVKPLFSVGDFAVGAIVGTLILAPFVWTALGRRLGRAAVRAGTREVRKMAGV